MLLHIEEIWSFSTLAFLTVKIYYFLDHMLGNAFDSNRGSDHAPYNTSICISVSSLPYCFFYWETKYFRRKAI